MAQRKGSFNSGPGMSESTQHLKEGKTWQRRGTKRNLAMAEPQPDRGPENGPEGAVDKLTETG